MDTKLDFKKQGKIQDGEDVLQKPDSIKTEGLRIAALVGSATINLNILLTIKSDFNRPSPFLRQTDSRKMSRPSSNQRQKRS